MTWALRSCDVYCCTGCGFTGTQLYNEDDTHSAAHLYCEHQCVKLWSGVAVPVWHLFGYKDDTKSVLNRRACVGSGSPAVRVANLGKRSG